MLGLVSVFVWGMLRQRPEPMAFHCPGLLDGDDSDFAFCPSQLLDGEAALRGLVFDGFHLHRSTGQKVHQKDDDVALLAAFLMCWRGSGDRLIGSDVNNLLPGDAGCLDVAVERLFYNAVSERRHLSADVVF